MIDFTNDELTVHEQIKKKLDELGISESELCRKAGIDRQVMFRLSQKDSKPICHIRKLVITINEIEKEIKRTREYEHLGGNENEIIN